MSYPTERHFVERYTTDECSRMRCHHVIGFLKLPPWWSGSQSDFYLIVQYT
jgi:hypothetical protein